ncbi:Amuc_1100 family pilus-like protein [Luteolibacter luteus]|uniref:Uncharacterized protein n=1 Tax=Luteolibacter luteus TaxID=2728835 RepID=A0A858RJP9_9BACT|nr:Amuc_1100 family pilus-like protein [Luteolibacter luteus]QJE97147.1 hypothetical protein HHL09_15570 [Luteolibacter luteus]
MSWIQENRFAAGLGGITLVAAGGLIFWAVSGSSKYNKAKEDYAAAVTAVDSMEGGKLYPNDANLKAKKAAVEDYDKGVQAMQKAFDAYRTPTPANVEPDAFNEALRKAKDTAAAAFEASKTELPPEFFLGFEKYTTSPVKREATGILSFEMEALSQLAANLAEAAPTKLLNIYRESLPEEDGKAFDAKGKSFRTLPIEISFNGNEDSVRKFLSSLDDSGKHYFLVRSMRISNEKAKAPTAADGNFKAEEADGGAAPAAGGAAADPFGGAGGFVLPGEEPAAPAADPAAATPAAPAAAAGGDGVILQQVLGSEKINAFFRIDIVQFLPDSASAGGKQPSKEAASNK